ncbi:MAG: ADP-ribosylglycohydrolase family protein [Defluviitaleaceae bacterium]|nr:ADP-ribosylglycohydrolase family protein [Defluviitaleaceae bacterium]
MLSREEYRSKVLGCWLGKNIGGTLGAPFEWHRQVNNVDYYTQELGGNPLPNDDLDIQLLWLIMLEEQGINIDSQVMAEYWQYFVSPFWSEYGNAKLNMQAGLLPPFTGMRNNYFKDSCGAFIRSEIWACIAPGNPRVAVKYAYNDASLDHGDGEGMYAEIFCAAMESAAFLENDPKTLIKIGLSYIPNDSGIAKAVRCAQEMYQNGKSWLEARNEILEKYRGNVFFNNPNHISKEDVAKGFTNGKPGWDAPSNIGMLIIGLLYGEGDFDKSICITVNCGEDTDCTAATIGSIFGIMHGVESIPEKWVTPIGRGIKTACLNIGDLGYFGAMIPTNIDDLTVRTEAIMNKVAAQYSLPIEPPNVAPDAQPEGFLLADDEALSYTQSPAYRQSHAFYDVALEYLTGVTVSQSQPAKLRLIIKNKYRIQAGFTVRLYSPEDSYGWEITPGRECKAYVGSVWWGDSSISINFELKPQHTIPASNRFVIEITADGRSTIMLIPVHLISEPGIMMA